jgi:hypothetical protein
VRHGDPLSTINLVIVVVYYDVITARSLKHVGDEFGCNGCSGFIFFVLSGVWETRYYGCYPAGRGRATSVYHDEEFHQMVVDTVRAGLDDEHVFITNGFP